MKKPLWLAAIALSAACNANVDTKTSALTANSSGECVQKDVGESDSAVSIWGGFVKDNPNNCANNPAICENMGLGFICKMDSGCCTSSDSGACNKTPDCTNNAKAVCIERACVPCKADAECTEWATARRDSRNLCISGVCKECRGTTDCKDPAKPVCDTMIGSDTINSCYACRQDTDCPLSNVCKKDEAISDTQMALGSCLQNTEIAYVNNTVACSAAGPGTVAMPFCELNDAVQKGGKAFIQITGSASVYKPLVAAGGGVRVVILGPGRDSAQPAIIQGLDVSAGASVTLRGVQVAVPGGSGTAVKCGPSGTVYLREVFIKDSNEGVNADCTRFWMESSRVQLAARNGINILGNTIYRIVNSVVMYSGGAAAQHGVSLGGSSNGYFAFNTVTGNIRGVTCSAGQRLSDSVISTNQNAQVEGNCVESRVEKAVVVMSGSGASPADPTLTQDTCCVDKASQTQVDADLKLVMPAQISVKDDYLRSARPKGAGFDIGHKELR